MYDVKKTSEADNKEAAQIFLLGVGCLMKYNVIFFIIIETKNYRGEWG